MNIIIKNIDQDIADKIEDIIAEKNKQEKLETVSEIIENLRNDIKDAHAKFEMDWFKLTEKKKIERPFDENAIDDAYNQVVGK